jgi:hypothetical protein
MIRKLGYCTLLLAMAAAPVLAQAQAGDPPSRVARLNFKTGSVSFRPGSVEDWTEASLNYPLTTGDHLWTQPGARAELHAGSTAIRMASETALAFLNLDDRAVQLSLTEGTIDVRILALAPGENFEVDTPNAAISLIQPGDYHVDSHSDANLTVVATLIGTANVTAGGSTIAVLPRQSARITGLDQTTQETGPAPPPNEFDQWCAARDAREAQSQSVRYVSRETIGYEDLDQYGTWRMMQPYGMVWVPMNVPPGWAPYHNGHWAWVEPWGWTWVDDAPWGFAPFHYGRWAYAGFWFWIPGTMAPRPVYAPALVAFVGGPGFGVSAAFGVGGGVAWFALGPGELYRPVYAVSPVYMQAVNVRYGVVNVNVVNVNYVNRGVPGAVIAVPQAAFAGARPVAGVAVAVDARELAQARVIGAAPPVAPHRESVLADPEQRRVGGPPARFADRAVVARMTPPPPPVSFAAKQHVLEANQGRPLDAAAVDNLRRSAPPPSPMVRTMQVAPGALRPAAQTAPSDRPPAARTAEQPRDQRPAAAPAPPPARPAAAPPKAQPAAKPPAKKPPEKRKEDK